MQMAAPEVVILNVPVVAVLKTFPPVLTLLVKSADVGENLAICNPLVPVLFAKNVNVVFWSFIIRTL